MSNTDKKENCPNKAEFIVPWAGKLYNYCGDHANRLRGIGEVIGASLEMKPITTDEKCDGTNDLKPPKK